MTAINVKEARVTEQSRMASPILQQILQNRYAGALLSLLIVATIVGITQPVFLTWPNLMNIVKSNSVVFVLAIGATFVVIAGAIDLSVASATAACAMVLGLLLVVGTPAYVAIPAAIAFGALLGAINGTLISYFKISFFVVTLGSLSMFQSFALIVNEGASVSVFSAAGFAPISAFVNGNIGPVPVILVFDLALLLISGAVLRYTAFGRALYAIGSNTEAARINGIDVKRVMLIVFVVAGLMAGLGSVVQVGRLTSASAEIDPTLLLTVLAAVLIGGTAYTGGEGGVFGTMVGVLFLGVIQNGLTLSGVSSFWQGMVSGLILILAVWFGGLRHHLRRQRQAKIN